MNNSALKISNVSKHFGGVKALTNINIEFNKGEIIGLIGSNGAGKSTLLNVIWGAFSPDKGEIFVNGEKIEKITPEKAQSLGISIIFQHRRLMNYMTVAENIFIDNMPKKNGFIDYKKMNADAMELMKMLDLEIDSTTKVSELTAEEKQLVEIVKACSRNPKILLMDEPTTALRQHEVDRLFEVMTNLKEKGCSVVFISHRLKEVMEICDKITIIRDGKNVIDGNKQTFTASSIIEHMSGIPQTTIQKEKTENQQSDRVKSEVLLSANNIEMQNVHDVSFELHKGEILGFAGLGGCGINDIFNILYGINQAKNSNIEIDGKKVKIKNPRQAIQSGIGYVSEDRQLSGEFLEMTVKDNVCISEGQNHSYFSLVQNKFESEETQNYIDKLSIKTESDMTLIKNLSGGNQQKAVISKWLHVKSRVIIMCEPTAGIDVAAKKDVTNLIKEIAKEGKGVLYTSSYITELMDVADRIVVIYKGEIFETFMRDEYDHNQIYLAINGITK